ncbi:MULTISPECIES: OapA family protein [Pantoea]|jgi:cell envelope opacity-associated protein A|uniref:Opacity-associated protein A n=2 Tax=Pantoea brenneri TaxID=472694 RepID=A0A7Y6NEG4_9GAMM|nr:MULTISPECIES: LysM-like peptidoglycan-binding domain-containing protein [Pantoea]MBS6032913.1 Opacity-associated protein A [Pantoea sp.]MDU4129061.1 LysM-like peptidoglycan-binding domain-containing protein [Pantoea sp.]MDU4745660.1 LysM-like peptidoglycan-binding domain-containing protein [Pantoea sp.]NUY42749.1 Opacity-associated protein A [Pantoea brenneri]NUY49607.1 Opacity-associated protein A [Pantoea brenneri]
MGQIAPRRRRTRATRIVSRLQTWLAARKPQQPAGEEEPRMASDASSRLPTWLHRIWHVTDHIGWMDPLPAPHRRGIVIALLVMLLAFLWPVSTPRYPVERPVTPSAEKEVPMQADIYDHKADSSSSQPQPTPKADSQGEWRNYTVASGQTLAQLFRDNSLPVNDVFAMARVEGSDQPLSSLKSGQQVKIRQDAQGAVTGLTIEGANGPVLFTRQPDGSFIRAQ